MTSNRRLHRLAAFAAASVLFAITSTVSALASSGQATSNDAPPAAVAPAAVALAAVDAEPSGSVVAKVLRPAAVPTPAAAPQKAVAVVVKPAAARPAASPKPAAKATPKATPRKATTTRVAAAKAVTPRTITISRYVDAPGSQKAIDACNLVLWTHAPLWLAAHNYCGFQWLASVPTGTIVRVTKGAAAGTFVVTGHLRLYRQSGALPAVKADLVLQTCVGSSTGLTLLRRV